MLSTQPEQVPTLAYYLPRDTRFGTPLGPVSDPRVTDWVNALVRFRRSSVRTVLGSLIRPLAPGQRVALVVPTRTAQTPLWAALIARRSVTWARYLRHDAHLRLLKVLSPDTHDSVLPVRISLFGVVGSAPGKPGRPPPHH